MPEPVEWEFCRNLVCRFRTWNFAHADCGHDFLIAFSSKSIQQACFAQTVEEIVHVMLILERKVLGDIVQ